MAANRTTNAYKARILQRWEDAKQDGMTLEEFCREYHITKDTLYRWRRQRQASIDDLLLEGLIHE